MIAGILLFRLFSMIGKWFFMTSFVVRCVIVLDFGVHLSSFLATSVVFWSSSGAILNKTAFINDVETLRYFDQSKSITTAVLISNFGNSGFFLFQKHDWLGIP